VIPADAGRSRRVEPELATTGDAASAVAEGKNRFLANVSHELRTPLNAIIGCSEILLEEVEERGHRAYLPDLHKIQAAGKHLLALIDDLLDLSDIEAGRIEVHRETFDLARLIGEAANAVQPLAEKNQNRLEVRCAADLGAMHSDAVRVRRVLVNVLSNACKFTYRGRILLEARRERASRADEIVFTVTDEGIGMTAEQVAAAFEPFAHDDSSTARRNGGTGLGLAIAGSLCHLLRGSAACRSEPGKGSTFVIRLPDEVEAMRGHITRG
jgi:signal transduction histidine kinase